MTNMVGHKYRNTVLRSAAALVMGLFFTANAFAADGPEVKTPTPLNAKVISTDSTPAAGLSSSSNFILTLPRQSTVRLLDLNLDLTSVRCLADEHNCLREDSPVDMGFSKSISSNSKKGLDLELVPSASVRFDDDGSSAALGAVVRIGEDLRANEVSSNTWYVFAGADAEAFSYSPESATRGQFGLSDRVIIGDAQAGIGYRIGSADVSLGYVRREISTLKDSLGTEGFSKSEESAALSFTWKR